VLDFSQSKEMIYKALESMAGFVITDTEGRIIYLSRRYADILEVDAAEAVGKPVATIIPRTRMQVVTRTGCEEIGAIFKLKNGESVLVNRIPITADGKVVGAFAFSTFSTKELNTAATIERVQRLNQEVCQYKKELKELRGAKYSIEQIIGASSSIGKIKETIRKISQTKSTVLITGETGTGKELVAHAIHQLSPRNHHSFIRVNCAAIPPDLLESELFGYEEGAFTGAKKGGKPGKFEIANYGTLLLDEINQMPVYLQSKLLRVIQESEIERVGGNKLVDVDVRLIFTTNQDLLEMVRNGEFREDLYYRINVVTVDVPPLRDRKEDIPALVNYFIKKINREIGLHITDVDQEVMNLFQSHHWPGNIRELGYALERAANIQLSGNLGMDCFENLLLRIQSECFSEPRDSGLASARAQAEKEKILQALNKANGNVKLASQFLKIHRSVLYDKIKKYRILI
jgi:transcriptional regulator with PAS, ATPase and Fis domain